MVKWNAGHSKYKFDENALLGHRVMNNALALKSDDQDTQGDLEYGEGQEDDQ